jgi:hypothetical protein
MNARKLRLIEVATMQISMKTYVIYEQLHIEIDRDQWFWEGMKCGGIEKDVAPCTREKG